MNLTFEYPNWLLLVCLVFAILFAGWMYRKDRLNGHLAPWLRGLLGVVRLVAMFLISLFLLHPLLKTILREVEAPIVVVAVDNSESMLSAADSNAVRTLVEQRLPELVEQLSADFEVVTYHFGAQLYEGSDSLAFTDKVTDFEPLMDGLYNRFSNRNVGAIIVASDGVYNRGQNPVYGIQKLNAPVYTIAVGDTLPKRDIRIARVASNQLAYLGNKFPVEMLIEGRDAAGSQSTLRIERGGQVVHSETVAFTQSFHQSTVRVLLDADRSGNQRYNISLSPISNEATTANNQTSIFVEVLENKQKVLIVTAAPHPDAAALNQSIRSNENYEVTTTLADDFTGKLSDYSLVIFIQIPHISGQGKALATQALESGVPSWFVLGSNSSFNDFNALKTGYSLAGFRGTMSDIYGSYSKGFSTFRLDDDAQRMFREMPPLQVPFGELTSSPGTNDLAKQRVGSIDTDLPLISFNKAKGTSVAVIFGEGLWRWRMIDFVKKESHARFDGILTKMVQFTANKEDRRQFRIKAPKNQPENERLLFEAEVYDETFQALTDPEVSLLIRDSEKREYPFTFSRGNGYYTLDAGSLPVGDYTWTAQVLVGGKTLTSEGQFSVYPLMLETAQTTANHKLLNQLAMTNGGEMVSASEVGALAGMITSNKNVTSIAYERNKMNDLIDVRWLLALILGLLSIEWLVRKRSGTY